MTLNIGTLVGRSTRRILFCNGSITRIVVSPLSSEMGGGKDGDKVFTNIVPKKANRKFYCPPGSEEYCIAGHMPGMDTAEDNAEQANEIISEASDTACSYINPAYYKKKAEGQKAAAKK